MKTRRTHRSPRNQLINSIKNSIFQTSIVTLVKHFGMTEESDIEGCNYDVAGNWVESDDVNDDTYQFEIAGLDMAVGTTLNTNLKYIRKWVERTKLHVIQNVYVSNSYRTHK